MKRKWSLLLKVFLLICTIQVHGQTLWSDDFESYADDSGYKNSSTSGDYPASVTKWTLDVSAATLSANTDWFMVNTVSGNNLFETRDTDGECIWTSESISISNYTDVAISVSISETGSLDANDYIKLYYKLDGGAETLFSTNGSNIDDFTALTASQSGLSGSTLQIIIKTDSDKGTHKVRFDDVSVTAKRADPASFSTSSASSTSVSFSTAANSANDQIVVAYNTTNTFGTPTGSYNANDAISGGGTVYYVGSASSITNHTGLTTGQTYYYKAWSFDGTSIYSDGLSSNATPACENPNDVSSVVSTSRHTFVDLSWVNGLCGDEILVVAKAGSAVTNTPSGDGSAYTANSVFASGTDIGNSEYVVYKGTGTSVSVTGLTNGTTYHFSIFSRVGTNWNSGITDSETPQQLKLIITEVAEPSGANSSSNFLEIKNVSDAAIDFDVDTYYISKQSNGGNTWNETQLSGTICSGCIRTYAKNSGTFETKYGHAPDFSSSAVSGTGDDAYYIYSGGNHNSGTLVDIYGVINQDGTGEAWEYTGSRAVRNSGITSGLVTWDASEWTITAATVSDMTPDAQENEMRYIGTSWRPGSVAPSTSSTTKALVIQSGTATISAEVDCASIETISGSSIEINAGIGVTVNGDVTNNCTIVLNSDETSQSSMKVTGTATGTTYKYKQYLTGGVSSPWHLITSPFESQSISDFVNDSNNNLQTSASNNYGLAVYNVGTDAWNYYHNGSGSSPNIDASSAGDFISGKGYSVLRANSGYVSFTGTVNTDSQSTTLTADKWNLVGNPYPSFVSVNNGANSNDNLIDACTAVIHDCYEAIYVWNGDTDRYDIVNHASSAVYLSPAQGYYVYADGGGGDYTFTEAMQSHQAGDWFERSSEEWASIELSADFSGIESSVEVKYIEGTTLGLDMGYDAGRFTGGNNDFFIGTKFLDGQMWELDLGVQCIPPFDEYESYAIPVSVNVVEDVEVTFSVSLLNFPSDTLVYLEDTYNQTLTRLDLEGSVYTTFVSPSEPSTGRFYIHTETNDTKLIEEIIQDLSIYVSNNSVLNIIGEIRDNTYLKVFDAAGRLILENNLHNSENVKIPLPNLSAGMYMIQINMNGYDIVKKVVIM
jgi:hypothetical protein